MRKQRLKRLMQELVNWIKRWKSLRDLLENIRKNLVHWICEKIKIEKKENTKKRSKEERQKSNTCNTLFFHVLVLIFKSKF